MILGLIYTAVLSIACLAPVLWMLRDADRRSFPETFLPIRAPKVLDWIDNYSPLDHRGLV